MRIGINALFQPNGGSLRNLTQLLKEWHPRISERRHTIIVFCGSDSYAKLSWLEDERVRFVKASPDVYGPISRLLVEQGPLLFLMNRYEIDVLFCPANISPLFSTVPCVTTVQNMAPWCAEYLSGDIRSHLRFGLLGTLTVASAKRAAKTIFLSHYAKDSLTKRYRLTPDKLTVIYRARDDSEVSGHEAQILQDINISQPYILTVSNLHRYKNIEYLIEGYSRPVARLGDSSPQLVIAGAAASEKYRESLERMADNLCGPKRVRYTGAVSPDIVGALLRSCLCFTFTSSCENCPNALIEALSSGAAIGCSQEGVMPEIAGEAVLYFDPKDSSAIESVLERLVIEPDTRRMLQDRALKQSRRFPTASQMALETLAVIESACKVTTK